MLSNEAVNTTTSDNSTVEDEMLTKKTKIKPTFNHKEYKHCLCH